MQSKNCLILDFIGSVALLWCVVSFAVALELLIYNPEFRNRECITLNCNETFANLFGYRIRKEYICAVLVQENNIILTNVVIGNVPRYSISATSGSTWECYTDSLAFSVANSNQNIPQHREDRINIEDLIDSNHGRSIMIAIVCVAPFVVVGIIICLCRNRLLDATNKRTEESIYVIQKEA